MILTFQMAWLTAWTQTAASSLLVKIACCAGVRVILLTSYNRAILVHLLWSHSMIESSSWWGRTALISSQEKIPSTAGSSYKYDTVSVQLHCMGKFLPEIYSCFNMRCCFQVLDVFPFQASFPLRALCCNLWCGLCFITLSFISIFT